MISLYRTLPIAFGLTLLSPVALAKSFKVDAAHSSVGFSIKHLVISNVKGRFNDFSGTFALDDKTHALTSAEGEVKTKSIDTGHAKRDEHLRSSDFFGVDDKNPASPNNTIKFKLNKFAGDGKKGTATGDITIHGITKPITLDIEIGGVAKDPQGSERAAFTADGRINRKDFGLTWNKALEAGGVVLSEEVAVHIEVEGVVP
jgi:polyisoprenoid-binding protein YceI